MALDKNPSVLVGPASDDARFFQVAAEGDIEIQGDFTMDYRFAGSRIGSEEAKYVGMFDLCPLHGRDNHREDAEAVVGIGFNAGVQHHRVSSVRQRVDPEVGGGDRSVNRVQ